MDFEPQKLFVGVIDFFSILMPGAFLTYLYKDWVIGAIGYPQLSLEGAEAWAVFLFISYLAGHFVFLLGARLDNAYGALREATRDRQVERLAEGKPLSPSFLRIPARRVFGSHPEAALKHALRIKSRHLSAIDAGDSVNTFQWSKALLTMKAPAALAAVERFEADSKFFRSFVIGLLFSMPVALRGAHSLPGIVSAFLLPLALIALAFWRYTDQRFKATEHAYWFVITLEAEGSQEGSSPVGKFVRTRKPDEPTHAGGIVFRQAKNRVEFLLVQASAEPSHWVLPKGHIEAGENAKMAAVREVREETGVWGRVLEPLGFQRYKVGEEPVIVQVYLMERLDEERADEKKRIHRWLDHKAARHTATFDDIRSLLDEAHRRIVSASRTG